MKAHAVLSLLLIGLMLVAGCNSSPVQPSNRPPSVPQIDEASGAPGSDAPAEPIYLTLRWLSSDPDGDSLRFDLYVDTAGEPSLIADDLEATSFDLPRLEFDRTYFWRVVADDGAGHSISSGVWTFHTAPQLPPTLTGFAPGEGASEVPLDMTLSWEGSDPNGEALIYSVYFDTLPDPKLADSNMSEPSFHPKTLYFNQEYYWKVEVTDEGGNSVKSPISTFTSHVGVIVPLTVGNQWWYDVVDEFYGYGLHHSIRLSVSGTQSVMWDGECYDTYHWGWYNETLDSLRRYYDLVRNEPTGLWSMGTATLAGDIIELTRRQVVRYPVKAGDRWVVGDTVGAQYERWICEATREPVTTPAGEFEAVKYVIDYYWLPNGSLSGLMIGSRRSKLTSGAEGELAQPATGTAVLYYVPDLGMVGYLDAEYYQWLTDYQIE